MKTFMEFLEGYDEESPIKVGDKVAFALDYLKGLVGSDAVKDADGRLKYAQRPIPPELEQAKGVVTDVSYHHRGPSVMNAWLAVIKWDTPEAEPRVWVDNLVKLDGNLQRDPNGSGRRRRRYRPFDSHRPWRGGWPDGSVGKD